MTPVPRRIGLAAAATLGSLGFAEVARADHPREIAGGLWPLASALILALAFVLMAAAAKALERRHAPRPRTEDRPGDDPR